MTTRTGHRPLAWLDEELASLKERGLLRQAHLHDGPQAARFTVDGRELVNFGSNDYLGLAADPRVIAAAQQAAEREGWGAGASPLVSGRAPSHDQLEQRLAEFEAAPAALLFSSGYAANAGTIAALAGRGDAVYSDEKNHASIVDGCRLSRAEVHTFAHRDVEALRRLLESSSPYRRRLIVSDSVFSMDGDLAPLADLADLAEEYQCMLMVDEAHATGVFGERGRGLAEATGVLDRVHVRVGTLSKALASAGGFVSGSVELITWLANRARTYVFSTAHPPAESAAAIAALDIVIGEPRRRVDLLDTAQRLRAHLRSQGWNVGDSASQIIPVLIGNPEETMSLAIRLRKHGLFVPGIRPPSVPPGESLLRLSLTSAHTPDMIDQLADALGQCRA